MIAFTICSNNYLAHAKTLGESFLQHHPDSKFIIGLADTFNENFDYSFFENLEIIPVANLKLSNLEELYIKYNITEFNTAIKPSYFHYIFMNYQPEKVLYIDPDILVLSKFDEVIEILDTENIVITPHILSPIDDGFAPTDYQTLRGGVFNLGFIGLSNYNAVKYFLDWWHERVCKYGFCNFSKNMFYDQLWINYVPCFFDNYHILKQPGYNMANWNLHERELHIEHNIYCVNKKYPLRFFHFSSYNFEKPDIICSYLTRYSFENRPDIKELFDFYQKSLVKNKVKEIKKLNVYYYPSLNVAPKKKRLAERVTNRILNTVRFLITGHA